MKPRCLGSFISSFLSVIARPGPRALVKTEIKGKVNPLCVLRYACTRKRGRGEEGHYVCTGCRSWESWKKTLSLASAVLVKKVAYSRQASLSAAIRQ
eukprot:1305166-Amphidinium_carterae.1